MKSKYLKILCKKCGTQFEYKGNLEGAVEYVKCANIFKIVYGINILCPNCMSIVNPQVEGTRTVGVPVEQVARSKRAKDGTRIREEENTKTRKANLAKIFEEVKKNLSREKEDTDEHIIDEQTKRMNKIREIQDSIKERDSKTEATHGPRPFAESNPGHRPERSITLKPPTKDDRKDSRGWHLKISKKQGRFLKKIGFSLIAIAFLFSIKQIIPDLISSKLSYASNSGSQDQKQEIEHDEEFFTDETTPSGALNIGKLHELLNRKKAEKENDKIPESKPKAKKAAWVIQFSKYITNLNITSPYGFRKDPFTGKKRFHTGIDVPRRYRSPVKALMSGRVIFSGYKGGYGNLVILKHDNGLTSYYGHNAKNVILKGDFVEKGKIIAYVGMTGRTTGPHLHFEVRKNGGPINPVDFLKNLFKEHGRVTI